MQLRLPLTLQTKLGRRVALLFVASALLPVGVLAVEGYQQVRRQLLEQATDQLDLAAKNIGMGLLDRLNEAAAILTGAVRSLDAGRGAPRPAIMERAQARETFSSLAIVDRTGTRAVWGERPRLALSPAELDRIVQDRRLLRVDSARAVVWLVAGIAGGGQLWAAVDGSFLFRGIEDRARVGATEVHYCVRAVSTGVGLICPGMPLQESSLAGRWNMFLGYAFGAAGWRVDVAQPIATALEPIAAFRRTFVLSMITVFALVIWLSSVQVRRTLQPLAELGAGTRRLADRDFTGSVSVSSGDEFEELANSFNRMTVEVDQQFRTLAAVNAIDQSALVALRAEDVAGTAAGRLREALRSERIDVLIAGERPEDRWSRVCASNGDVGADGSVQLTAADRVRLRDAGAHGVDGGLSCFGPSVSGNVRILPLISHEELIGAVAVHGAAAIADDRMAVAEQLANQLAVGLSNARLITRLNGLSYGALSALARTVDANSPWTSGHSERVAALSLRIAQQLQLPIDELHTLYRGGLLHDIGKIGVPGYILDRAGPLSEEEQALMRRHPGLGANILKPIAAFAEAVPIVLSHHERVDGAGYPQGLKGDDIPFLARLLSVADVYDALVSDRPYRIGMQSLHAVSLIVADAGASFDPPLVDAFVDVMRSEGDEARFAAPPAELSTRLL